MNDTIALSSTFRLKAGHGRKTLSDQDEKHIRILAILQYAHMGQIEDVLSSEFDESFEYDPETGIAKYTITIRKEVSHAHGKKQIENKA